MLRLARETDLVMIQSYPDELQQAISDELTILDENYGSERDVYHDYGGYIIFTESEKEIPDIEGEIKIEISVDAIPEYVDIIRCSNKKTYTSSLFLLGSDYGVIVVMPYEITPDNIKRYIE